MCFLCHEFWFRYHIYRTAAFIYNDCLYKSHHADLHGVIWPSLILLLFYKNSLFVKTLKFIRSNYRSCYVKKSVAKNFANFTEKHLFRSLFLMFINKSLQHRCFPVKVVKFLRTSISEKITKILQILQKFAFDTLRSTKDMLPKSFELIKKSFMKKNVEQSQNLIKK